MPNGLPDDFPITVQSIHQFLRDTPNCSFLTITIKPKLYKYNSITQLEMVNSSLYKLLFKHTDKYVCVAEHTKQANIHFHAIVSFVDTSRKIGLINSLKNHKDIGFIKFDSEISNDIKCSEYMTKDLYENYKYFTSMKGKAPLYFMTNTIWDNLFNIFK